MLTIYWLPGTSKIGMSNLCWDNRWFGVFLGPSRRCLQHEILVFLALSPKLQGFMRHIADNSLEKIWGSKTAVWCGEKLGKNTKKIWTPLDGGGAKGVLIFSMGFSMVVWLMVPWWFSMVVQIGDQSHPIPIRTESTFKKTNPRFVHVLRRSLSKWRVTLFFSWNR